MPQGSWIGRLSFLALINDLTTGCPVLNYYYYKYQDYGDTLKKSCGGTLHKLRL